MTRVHAAERLRELVHDHENVDRVKTQEEQYHSLWFEYFEILPLDYKDFGRNIGASDGTDSINPSPTWEDSAK